jgi:hypothetical protein
VQATWTGTAGTTGAAFFDYVLTDRLMTPPAMQPHYEETFCYLPGCYYPYDGETEIASATITRTDEGLPDGAIVLACFCAHYKIDRASFASWCDTLRSVPDTVLWLLGESPEGEANLRTAARAAGIDPARLVFAGRKPRADHMARLSLADLALDTFIYAPTRRRRMSAGWRADISTRLVGFTAVAASADERLPGWSTDIELHMATQLASDRQTTRARQYGARFRGADLRTSAWSRHRAGMRCRGNAIRPANALRSSICRNAYALATRFRTTDPLTSQRPPLSIAPQWPTSRRRICAVGSEDPRFVAGLPVRARSTRLAPQSFQRTSLASSARPRCCRSRPCRSAG